MRLASEWIQFGPDFCSGGLRTITGGRGGCAAGSGRRVLGTDKLKRISAWAREESTNSRVEQASSNGTNPVGPDSFPANANLTQTKPPSAPAGGGPLASEAAQLNVPSQPLRHGVVLADDHPSVRRGLRRLIDPLEDFEVVAETGDGYEALGLVMRLNPALLICDLSMPGLHGLELTRSVRTSCPATRVVILSVQADEPYVLRGLEAGASGYVIKGANSSHLLAAIRAAMRGERYLSPPFPASLLR